MDKIEKKLLSERFGIIDPLSIDAYIEHKGYAALKKTVKMTQSEIIDQVKISGLRGRGGAAFPVALKLDAVRKEQGTEKYIICNADEGEPGNFKDRYLMENDPHQIIEGMIISAYAIGTCKGYIFIRGEYKRAIYVMNSAIKAAEQKGYLGENILGSGLNFSIEVYSGGGSYVSGEEFALMASLEGDAARSTFKPPFPTTEGLYKKPTQINNVESFANIPHIVLDGGEAFAKIGTESSKGTKLISLCGNVCNKGVYEVPFGVSFRDIIEKLGGGVPNGRNIKMVQLGGASGPCISPDMLDLKLDYKEIANIGLSFGSGAIIVMDDRIDVLDIVRNTLEFFHHESCGKCTPCREGTVHLLILLDRFILRTATEEDMKRLKALIETMKQTALCGLGQAASTSLETTMKYFHEEYTSRMKPCHAHSV